jgi:hypothetical protein
VQVNRDLFLTHTGGTKILLSLNNTAVMSVARDIQFSATGDNQAEISINNTAGFNLGRQVVRGSPAYGLFTFNRLASPPPCQKKTGWVPFKPFRACGSGIPE